MVRDDDIGEVPNLGPARDALDDPQPRPQPERKPPPVAEPPRVAKPAATRVAAAPAARHGHGFLYLLLLLLITAAAGFGYWSQQRVVTLEARLLNLQQQQTVSGQKIAVLEGLISATDESAAKSGAALQAQVKKILQEQDGRIKHVDSEIAKLWSLSNQRNRPKLEALEKSVAGLDSQLQGIDKGVGALRGRLDQQGQTLSAAGQQLNQLGAAQAAQQAAGQKLAEQQRLRDLANQELDELQDAQLKQLGQQLAALKQNPQLPAKAQQSLDEYGRALESINAFRKQINQEVLRLRDRVNSLQLQAPSKPAS